MMNTINLELTIDEVNTLLNVLAEQQWKMANGLIVKINEQANAQQGKEESNADG